MLLFNRRLVLALPLAVMACGFTPAYGPKITLSAMVNNLFNRDLVTNGYYYTYDDTWSAPGVTTTVEGAGFYPQAGRHFLVGLEMAW